VVAKPRREVVAPASLAEHLVSQADAEDRDTTLEQPAGELT